MFAFVKKVVGLYVLALVFLAVYETVRVSFSLSELRFVGPIFTTQPFSSFVILSFVAVLTRISMLVLVLYVDSSFSWASAMMEFLVMIMVYAVCFIALHFAISPFVSWALILFHGPHQSLFDFYWAAWQRFDGFDALALFVASSAVGLLVVLTFGLYSSWESGLHPRRYPVS